MSSSLSPVSQLVAVIQSQLARPAARRPDRRSTSTNGGADAGYAPARLAGLIAVRVGQIDRDDPQRGRKALRVFLEAVLLAHFGARFANDPAFQRMLDDIQLNMEGHPQCRTLLDQAISHLLSE